MGFQRDKVKEKSWLKYKRHLREQPKRRELNLDEKIAHAICALGLIDVHTHHIQKDVCQWVSSHYKMVNPETVGREWRRMVSSGEHDIEKYKEGKYARYKIKRLFNLTFDEDQLSLF